MAPPLVNSSSDYNQAPPAHINYVDFKTNRSKFFPRMPQLSTQKTSPTYARSIDVGKWSKSPRVDNYGKALRLTRKMEKREVENKVFLSPYSKNDSRYAVMKLKNSSARLRNT